MKIILFVSSSLLLLQATFAQPFDTIPVYNAACISGTASTTDTTNFKLQNDTLYIETRHGAQCCASFVATYQIINDTVVLMSNDTNTTMCSCGCNFKYEMKIPFFDDTTIVSFRNNLYQVINLSTSTTFPDPNKWSVYPNPATDLIYIYAPSPTSQVVIRLFDMTGKLIFEARKNLPASLHLYEIKRGEYLIEISLAESIYRKKFVKI